MTLIRKKAQMEKQITQLLKKLEKYKWGISKQTYVMIVKQMSE